MKVEFTSVALCPKKIQLVNKKSAFNNQEAVGFTGVSNSGRAGFKTVGLKNSNNNLHPANFSRCITFTGNTAKNVGQFLSIAPEYQGILNNIYKLGGLGNVAGEAAVAFHDHGGADLRTIIPYHSPENLDGKIKIRTPIMKDGSQLQWDLPALDAKGKVILDAAGNGTTQKVPAFEFCAVDLDYQLKQGENFVIHEPVIKGKEWQTGYKVIKDTGLKGSVDSVNSALSGVDKVPYRLFQVEGTSAATKGNPTVYVMHTPDLAKFAKSYNSGVDAGAYGGAYGGGAFSDLSYSQFSKASMDVLPKMATEEFGGFNPASMWLHDRQAFSSEIAIAEASSKGNTYFDGLRVNGTFHNPGRDYQGHYTSPIDFYRIVASEADLKELQNNSQYPFVKKMIDKIDVARKEGKAFDVEKILSKDEMTKLNSIFSPAIGQFVDEKGEYNMCKIPVVGVERNPHNMTAGTVSTTYGKEMKNHNTKEIALGLTSDFARIPTIDIVNGSTPANLHLDEIGQFGKECELTISAQKGFTPLTKEVMSDVDKLFSAKQSNKKWLINAVSDAADEGSGKLAKLFFSDSAIDGGATVLGGLSKYKEGDMLFLSWGRPDTQKGFPVTLEGFLQFFQDKSVDDKLKSKVKVLVGAGPWASDAADFKTIQEQIKAISEMDGGKYAKNVCYMNGFSTNRLVACSDFAVITSRYEPCGITPLESFSAGTPVISHKTGGSPDFIVPYIKGQKNQKATGFLTKHPFFVNPEVIGADPSLTGEALDTARRTALGKENAQCIKEAVGMFTEDTGSYKNMMKDALDLKIDWHNNNAFNGGKSAMNRYFEDVWNLENVDGHFRQIDGLERCNEPLKNLKGHLLDVTEGAAGNSAKQGKNGFLSFLGNIDRRAKIGLAVAATVVAVGTLFVVTSKKSDKKDELDIISESNKVSQTKSQKPMQPAPKVQNSSVAQAPLASATSATQQTSSLLDFTPAKYLDGILAAKGA